MAFIQRIKALRHELWLLFWRKMPLKKNKVILWSDNFKTFGCSPKYIALELAKSGQWDVVWVLERGKAVPEVPGMRFVPYFSMKYLKEIATAKFIVCNHRTSAYHYFKKRKGQVYIQTWHSSLRLKMIEKDAPMLPQSYVDTAKADSRKIDLLLSGCRFSSEIFRRAFWYDGQILEQGTPRCDGLFGDGSAVKEKVYSFYGIEPGKKLALYAPTFRDDPGYSYGLDFDAFAKALGTDWVVGCRLHPKFDGKNLEGAIPMSGYPDMQELLIACDRLVTDYSSSMFDMAVAGKQCCLFVPDLAAYTAGDRGLYFDIRKLPFPVAEDMQSLCRLDFDAYEERRLAFLAQIGSFENGHAAENVVKWMQSAN
ncbi:MAG: CDP-glycerol glycerophosphotransferase family protein [Oscillospiraceae bacterium]|nr:CDP-glycerol glycerophosphotransferase family protein [Oscillospiraceae bacterium]